MAKTGRFRLEQAVDAFGNSKASRRNQIPGVLGFVIAGKLTVEVPGRPGFVYVRLLNNLSEVIMAYNESVSPVYNLPVYVSRDGLDKTRYVVTGRDTAQYSNWQSSSSYLPRHANQHSFAPELGGGGDVVWVYKRQIMPLLLYPSGSSGSGEVIINQDILYRNGMWQVVGGTGSPNLLGAKPTDNQARLMLLGIDNNGNPWVVSGSLFAGNITGTAAITPYLPSPSAGTILGAIRLVSGTSTLGWNNIYDLRNFFG